MQGHIKRDSTTILFSGDQALLGDGEILFCKVEPEGVYPVLSIEWDALEQQWKVNQIIEQGANNGNNISKTADNRERG